MSVHETVVRQSSSYRQGLVLGLTMAEVILLIVFALLIALAAVWRADREDRIRLEAKLKSLDITGSLADRTPADAALIVKLEALLRSPEGPEVAAILQRIASGQRMPALTDAEAWRVSEIKAQMPAGDPAEIDKFWREIVAAASEKDLAAKLGLAAAVERAAPGEADASKVAGWIAAGQRARTAGEHDWPPIINLHEGKGYTFAKGSAELTASFEGNLRSETIPQLLEYTRQYRVDVIEVIGHTDEQAIAQRNSNLDRILLDALKGSVPITSLTHGDNAGLGLSRAVSVVRALIRDGRLPQPQYRILPLSGGQLIGTDERVTAGGGGDMPDRRRIEIRLRRSQESLGRKE